MDAFLGEIRIFGGGYAPTGWAHCNGQLLPLSQNTALFALLGTFYGGDGKSTFALPDLQERVPMDAGEGKGLSERFIGETDGQAEVTLIGAEMPPHAHGLLASPDPADHRPPSATESLAVSNPGTIYQTDKASNLTTLATEALETVGADGPHENEQPYLVLNFIIALQGVFPQRS